jgi:hypothetical protein
MRLRVWRGGLYENPGGPMAVKCPYCDAEPGSLCWDMVDGVVKQNVHGERSITAGYKGPRRSRRKD